MNLKTRASTCYLFLIQIWAFVFLCDTLAITLSGFVLENVTSFPTRYNFRHSFKSSFENPSSSPIDIYSAQ